MFENIHSCNYVKIIVLYMTGKRLCPCDSPESIVNASSSVGSSHQRGRFIGVPSVTFFLASSNILSEYW
jgi:hypothetical protein